MKSNTSIYTDITTGECKCKLTGDTDKHTRCKQNHHASPELMIRGWLAWGSMNTPERSAEKSAERIAGLEGGCLQARTKWSFS